MISLFIDGKIQATVSANLPIPDMYCDSLGASKRSDCGFIIPLPMQVFDGAKHEMSVQLGESVTADTLNTDA